MKYNVEYLYQFECACGKTFSIVRFDSKIHNLYCPYCGKRQPVFSKSLICNKRKLTKIEAGKAVIRAFYSRVILGNKNRKEQREYFCEICNARHLTSREEEK